MQALASVHLLHPLSLRVKFTRQTKIPSYIQSSELCGYFISLEYCAALGSLRYIAGHIPSSACNWYA